MSISHLLHSLPKFSKTIYQFQQLGLKAQHAATKDYEQSVRENVWLSWGQCALNVLSAVSIVAAPTLINRVINLDPSMVSGIASKVADLLPMTLNPFQARIQGDLSVKDQKLRTHTNPREEGNRIFDEYMNNLRRYQEQLEKIHTT